MDDTMMEELSLEQMAQDDYKGFVKAFLRLEMGLSEVQLDRLYQEYMNEDDMSLLNPEFWQLVESIDWQAVYMTRHLEHLLTFTPEERDGIMLYLQKYYQESEIASHNWVSDGERFTDRGLSHINSIINSEVPFFQEVNAVYSKVFKDDMLTDETTTFLEVVNAAARADLLEDKEAFLRAYLDITEMEKSAQSKENKEAEKPSLSTSLDI